MKHALALTPAQRRKLSRTVARKVDMMYDPTDFRVALMGSMGMSTKAIMQQTGLSYCQVTYRLTKGAISRADYRNGASPLAQFILGSRSHKANVIVKHHLSNNL